jgi:hypothetical protein
MNAQREVRGRGKTLHDDEGGCLRENPNASGDPQSEKKRDTSEID